MWDSQHHTESYPELVTLLPTKTWQVRDDQVPGTIVMATGELAAFVFLRKRRNRALGFFRKSQAADGTHLKYNRNIVLHINRSRVYTRV